MGHQGLSVVWKVVAKQFEQFATLAESFEIVEGFGGAEQRLLCRVGVEMGEARVGECGVELRSFKKSKRSIAFDNLNFVHCGRLRKGVRVAVQPFSACLNLSEMLYLLRNCLPIFAFSHGRVSLHLQ